MTERKASTGVEQGFSLIELLVSMAIAVIIAAGATEVLTSFYSGSQAAQRLANRAAAAAMLTSIMDHTLGMQGYHDAATASVTSIPAENPSPTSPATSVGPVQSVTAYWLPTGATASPYCQGTLSTVATGVNWSVSGPAGCVPASAASSASYPAGAGWAFYLVPNTDCANKVAPGTGQVQQTATAVVARNGSTKTEAVACLSNQ